jgi:hypothetical protein
MTNIAILGASNTPSRYSYKAQQQLQESGYDVFPVSNHHQEILGTTCYRSLVEIVEKIDTVTVYVNPHIVEQLVNDIIAIKPRRAIFNPGSESAPAMKSLKDTGIEVQTACTLVLLATDQFDS